MVVAAAAITGAAALGGGALAGSSGKKGKGDSGNKALAEIAARLFGETEGLREETIAQSGTALRTGRSNSPLLAARKSSILAEGDREKRLAQSGFERAGLGNSSFAITGIEDIDRAIAQMLSNADIADTQRLTDIGTSIGFGQAPATATSAASALAQSQGHQRAVATQGQISSGQAVGNAIALLLNQKTQPQTPISNAPVGYNTGPTSGSGLELLQG